MFTLYGNQYESREEHLLLTMFQVKCFWENIPFVQESDGWHSVIAIECTCCTIRNLNWVWFTFKSKYSCISYDDHLHATWPRSIVPEVLSGRKNI
jgi:hypothetical protein